MAAMQHSRRTWFKTFAIAIIVLSLTGSTNATPGGSGEGGGRPPVIPPAYLDRLAPMGQ